MAEDYKEKPVGFENDLSVFGMYIEDLTIGEPIGWGFKILNRLGDERFRELKKYGTIAYKGLDCFLITKKLTREEAIQKYGEITHEEFGPRGGWRSVTFGEKKFRHEYLKPENKTL